MKFIRSKLIISNVILITALMTGCSGETDKANIRIIHASTGAAADDTRLDHAVATPDLDYPQSTGLVSINAGTYDAAIDAIVVDSNVEDVISVEAIPVVKDQRYTVVAISDVADINISEFIVSGSAATPGKDEVAISLLHAAMPIEGANVDVYVTASGDDITGANPNFSSGFKGHLEAGTLPTDEYQIRVVDGDGNANPAYDSGTVDMTGFAREKLLLLTINTVNSTTNQASPGKLLAYTYTAQVDRYTPGGADRYQEDSSSQNRSFISRCRSSRSVCF